jgi:hypothetical protein
MKYIIFCITFLLSVPFTCNRQEPAAVVNDSAMKITAGYVCGWGSGEDSLVITSDKISYRFFVPASSSKPSVSQLRLLTTAEQEAIRNAVDFKTFSELEYNTCNVCVDGCDEWIIIKYLQTTHEIRFSKGQQINSVSALQAILLNFRKEFNSPGWK